LSSATVFVWANRNFVFSGRTLYERIVGARKQFGKQSDFIESA